jgi:hypothetical protein
MQPAGIEQLKRREHDFVQCVFKPKIGDQH